MNTEVAASFTCLSLPIHTTEHPGHWEPAQSHLGEVCQLQGVPVEQFCLIPVSWSSAWVLWISVARGSPGPLVAVGSTNGKAFAPQQPWPCTPWHSTEQSVPFFPSPVAPERETLLSSVPLVSMKGSAGHWECPGWLRSAWRWSSRSEPCSVHRAGTELGHGGLAAADTAAHPSGFEHWCGHFSLQEKNSSFSLPLMTTANCFWCNLHHNNLLHD